MEKNYVERAYIQKPELLVLPLNLPWTPHYSIEQSWNYSLKLASNTEDVIQKYCEALEVDNNYVVPSSTLVYLLITIIVLLCFLCLLHVSIHFLLT